MPVTLGELRRNTRTVPVTYDDMTLSITFRPSAITPSFSDGDGDVDFLVKSLTRVMVRWDVYEDESYTEMTPITEEILRSDSIGLQLLRAMFDCIILDTLSGKRNGAISVAG